MNKPIIGPYLATNIILCFVMMTLLDVFLVANAVHPTTLKVIMILFFGAVTLLLYFNMLISMYLFKNH